MKRRWIFAALSAVSVITLLSSCFTGLDPAWKAQGTRFAITLPAIAEAPAESRALVQGVGFLYIRTIGGPSGPVGPFYGPFQVDKSSFETKLIPPGRFDSFMVLYSSVWLDDKQVGTSGKTFREVMSLPDAELKAFFEHEEGSPSIFDSFIDGYGSGAMTGSVTILDGVRNEIPSLTLEPFVATGLNPGAEGFTFSVSSEDTQMTKRFFRLDGIDPESTFATLDCSLKASSALGGMAGRIGLYDENGSLVRLSAPLGAMTAGAVKTISAPYTGNETYYLYLEYMGDFEVQCVGVQAVAPIGVNMQFTGGNAALANHRVFFGIYDLAQVSPYGGMPDTVLAAGTFTLDSSGNGSGTATVPGTTDAPSLVKGSPYLVNYFVDINDNYKTITSFDGSVDASGITPHFGDYVSNDMEVFMAGETIDVAGTELETSNGYVYFVSPSGTAVASGQVPSKATTLDAALSNVQSLRTTLDVHFEIYLMGDLNLANPITVNAPVSIQSLGIDPYTLTLQKIPGKAAITLITEADQIESSLYLQNVIIEGGDLDYDMSAIIVGENAELDLVRGAVIRNVNVPNGNGGAVLVQGGSLMMMGSEISGCTAKDGGGVYVSLFNETPGAIALMPGAVIKNNVADMSGGGVYVTSGSIFALYDADDTVWVSGNVAGTDGGGVYIAEGGILYDDLGLADTVIFSNVLSDGTTPSNLVYTLPPVSIMIGSGLDFDIGYTNYEITALELFEASAPSGFEQYQWTLNGYELPYTGSDISFTCATDLNPAFWHYGNNVLSVLVLKDGQLYSSEFTLIVTE